MTEKAKIGFIGVGFMGHGMAKNMLQKGHPMQVIGNRNRQPVESLVSMGATEAKSAREMAESVDILHLCLPNSASVEAIMYGDDGILAGAHDGLVVVDTTTADPTSTEALAVALTEKGAVMVDAPLGRTPKEAEAGTLDTMVGAPDEVFAKIKPVLECWAGNINHVGPTGAGHKMKLLMNFISMSYAALYSEALTLGTRSGITPQTFNQVIGSSRLSNGFFEGFMEYAVGRTDEPHKFSITNATKDLRYVGKMADSSGTAIPMAAAAKAYFQQAETSGRGGDFVVHLSDHIAELNGLNLAEEVKKGAK